MHHEGQPIASLPLPAHMPKPVARKYETFDSIADAYGTLLGEISDQAELARVDIPKARSEAAAARLSGEKMPRDPARVEADHAARAADLESELEIVRLAVGRAGDDLCDSIAECREEWISAVEAEKAKARARLAKALATARDALEELRPLAGAERYLAEFDVDQAYAGRQAGYSGGSLTLDASSAAREFSSFTEPAKLLDLLDELVSPTPTYVGTNNGRPVFTSIVRGRLVRHYEDGEPEDMAVEAVPA